MGPFDFPNTKVWLAVSRGQPLFTFLMSKIITRETSWDSGVGGGRGGDGVGGGGGGWGLLQTWINAKSDVIVMYDL